jgi:hypothetical protein
MYGKLAYNKIKKYGNKPYMEGDLNMKAGDYINTPRFCKVKIAEVFNDKTTAKEFGYCEPTYYDNPEYDIWGKHIDINRMIFAAIKK